MTRPGRNRPTVDSPLGDLIAGKIDQAEYHRRTSPKLHRDPPARPQEQPHRWMGTDHCWYCGQLRSDSRHQPDPPSRPEPALIDDGYLVDPEPVEPRVPYLGWYHPPRPKPIRHEVALVGFGVCIGIVAFTLLLTIVRALDGSSIAAPSNAPPVGRSSPSDGRGALARETASVSLSRVAGHSVAPVRPGGNPQPTGAVGAALIGGVLSYVAPRYGPEYLALPFPRGTVAEICGPADCVLRRSTDFGPDQRVHPDRIADLSAADWQVVCGLPLSRGTCRGTVELEPPVDPSDDRMRQEDQATLPPTDTAR